MLNGKEKRFIKYWEDQRKGGKWKYYLLYIPAGTFICSLVLSFLSVIWRVGFPDKIWLIVSGSLIIITFSVIATWDMNEKKFKKIIKREVKEGQLKDDEPARQ